MRPDKILIVEDEKLIALSLQRIVESLQYQVVGICRKGEEAIGFLKKNTADLVLMDIQLAGVLDGIETARQIHETYSIPFIYISAFSDKEIIERAKQTRPYGYLIKPFDKKNLNAIIEIALYRDKIEKKLRESEVMQLALMKAIPDFMVIIDEKCIVVEASLPAKAKSRLTATDYIGKTLSEIPEMVRGFDDETAREASIIVQKILKSQMPGEFSFRYRTERKLLHFESRLIPLSSSRVLAIIRNISEIKESEAAVLEAIVSTQDAERQRFAEELHDGIGQILTAAKFKLDSLTFEKEGLPPHKIANLESAKTLLSKAIEETRIVSHGLMPEVLNTFGLEAALSELCTNFSQKQNLKITFDSHLFNPKTPASIQIGIFRIAEKLLGNFIGNTSITEINLQLIQHKRRIVLMVEDNGRKNEEMPEFNINETRLKNIQARVSLMGGEIIFDVSPENGTTVTVDIPCKI